MKNKLLFAIILATLVSYISISQILYDLNHPLKISSRDDSFHLSNLTTVTKIDTVKVLAVMVEFVEDNDDRTTGNGKFNLSSPDSIIDSPPHNKNYFENHLLFLKNYWKKVTNNKIIIDYHILDSVFQLPNQMKYYSPPKKSTTFSEIGYLIEDTWKIVDSLYPNFPFETFDAFIIFHAGTGRDVDLTSIYGYDPTPYDIPTLYMNLNNLKQIFGYDYEGVRVKNGNFFIKNSLVIPSTENRKISTVGGTTLLQLSINGILTGTFGSYLGLPDLFNTRTGRTAIGRFGLMDGQSMFSWNGLFPPEPSAWEKYFLEKKYNLGFLKIVEVDSNAVLNLPAVGFSSPDTIYKVNINSKEYYLIENRNRDANRDGAKVTFIHNGITIQKTFQYDTDKFNYLNQSEIFGTLIDIDEPDWSLPGGVTKDGRFFDGGILIWHIDENVIEQNIASNTINADPKRRGVDLEEADGSQDIGQSYGFLSPGSGSEDGTSLDFWFKDNSAPVYKNEFSSKTFPNTLSNDFAQTHITIKNFSERSPVMTSEVYFGSDVIKPIARVLKAVNFKSVPHPPQVFKDKIFITNGDSVFAFFVDGKSATRNSNGLFFPAGGKYPLSAFENENFVLTSDSSILILNAQDFNSDEIYDSIFVVYEYKTNATITTPASVSLSPSLVTPVIIYAGDHNGNLHIIRSIFGGYEGVSNKITSSKISDIAISDKYILVVSADSLKIFSENTGFKLSKSSDKWSLFSGKRSQLHNDFVVSVEQNGSDFVVYDLENIKSKNLKISDGNIIGFAISDVDKNGTRDLIISAGNKLYAFNYEGVTLDNFPITLPDTAVSSPIVADINGDDVLDVLVACKNNLIAAYSASGKYVSGFPYSASTGAMSHLGLSSRENDSGAILVLTNSDGDLYTWQLPESKNLLWGNFKRDILHSSFDDSELIGSPISEYLPSNRAYNWPNPVYGNETNIRFYVSENSIITIKIFDVSGTLVDEIKTNATGGIDNEVVWNVSNIQSGIYYAHINAESSSNKNATLIKIAVIK